MEQIILYSNHCPQCRVLETKLKQKGIIYEEISNMDVLIEKGFLSVPILEVNGATMNFTEANKWINERD